MAVPLELEDLVRAVVVAYAAADGAAADDDGAAVAAVGDVDGDGPVDTAALTVAGEADVVVGVHVAKQGSPST